MAALTIIPYKPPHYITRKPSPKCVTPEPSSVKKNVWFDFSNAPIEKLQASGGVTGGSSLPQKVAGDSKATVEDVLTSGDDLVRTQGMC